MEPSPDNPGQIDAKETRELLNLILSELKSMNQRLSEQERRTSTTDTAIGTADSIQRTPSNNPLASSSTLSNEARSGPILREAIKRYNGNSVLHWSTLYGTHVSPWPGIEAPREATWAPLVGNLWRVPHDNRVGLCFVAPLEANTQTPLRVKRSLFQFHNTNTRQVPKGEFLNIWDWFDSGRSRYWHPEQVSPVASLGNKASGLLVDEEGGKDEEGRLEDGGGGQFRISPLVAPWRRVINMQGLTTIYNHGNTDIDQEQLTDHDLCPILLSETEDAIFQRPLNDMLWRAVRCHLRCLRATDTHHSELLTKGCVLFHVTFYEILESTSLDNLTELWPCGELHSDGQKRSHGGKRRRIRESALTLISVPSLNLPGGHQNTRAVFWTMLCLRPQQFPYPHYYEKRDDISQGQTHEMIDDMSDMIHKCLLPILTRWEEIAEYFDSLLCEKKALLDPDQHDTLLTDDWELSRSKKYFWAIEFLKEVEKSVTDNIRQTDRFLKSFGDTLPPADGKAEMDGQARIRKHEAVLARLEGLRMRFVQKKDEAVALRDGLFNASAVMESRTSTKLGENIKLLTFISIFFLPLSFCTSLWSISEDLFSISAFATTMPILALATYAVTLNLESIAKFPDLMRRCLAFQTSPVSEAGHPSSLPMAAPKRASYLWNWIPSFIRWIFAREIAATWTNQKTPSVAPLEEIHLQVQVEVDVESCNNTGLEAELRQHRASKTV
ncbi:hypothetical protein B0H63DRAFT_468360 [Podospora didyma]|uniref:Uncharacterized protein n=1 Tax=Podospora didyma TaxID=330526 RepID=A0AAE0NSA5_9PEZI|nr:hypothetical protein B0H63DRAFT_468360 [Podospora didyma]